ncbi:DUF4917 family protein [Tsukamurella columbiensis]|uniref:DUF4917 family protein n=1 Tax=Tsukamurella columbiensis TaxID=128509 RepID=A0ABX1LFZ6_9ACTN|nr:DUF4917 family protein [Tsukamurella columbiensis]NMD57137.1 DUF4917 family protein [Tsukamurella columbiensis]
MVKLRSFEDVVVHTCKAGGPVSVLLGNGFSQAYSSQFGYGSLREKVEDEKFSVSAKALFEHVGSDDFETVIDTLERAASLVEIYTPTKPASSSSEDRAHLQAEKRNLMELRDDLRKDAKEMKRQLVNSLTTIHPATSRKVHQRGYQRTLDFLGHFDQIFTLNYDLLLYWALMQSDLDPEFTCDDGFRKREGELRWLRSGAGRWDPRQNVFYLHGAMHLYVHDGVLHKLQHSDGNLMAQLELNLADGLYPLVVTEGTREDKEARIARSAYLRYGLRQLAHLEGSLVIHGAALSPNDKHILDRIARSKALRQIYVGLFGESSRAHDDTKSTMRDVVREHRKNFGSAPGYTAMKVHYYPSQTVSLWGE